MSSMICCLLWGLLVLMFFPVHSSAEETKPNIIIILADDLGYGDTSVYGGWVKTPQLEKMAAEGLKFTDFHTNSSVCSPTRAAFLTGRYQQRVGIVDVVAPSGTLSKRSAGDHHSNHMFEVPAAFLQFNGQRVQQVWVSWLSSLQTKILRRAHQPFTEQRLP